MRVLNVLLVIAPLVACGKTDSPRSEQSHGQAKETETTALELGAKALQHLDPVRQLDVYLDAFHTMKDDPTLMLEAHHFCTAKSEDLMQCVIYDGNTKDANLVGVEYIISEPMFDGLAEDEKKLWHPHNFEILSGQLVAPGLPSAAENAMLKKKLNSYGKTWHLWNTGHFGRPGENRLPIGQPMLAWSFNADGEAPPALVAKRDERLHVNTEEKRKERADWVPLAHPQQGVNDLARAFPNRKLPDFIKAK